MSFQYPYLLFCLIVPVCLAVWEWSRDSHAIPMPLDHGYTRRWPRFLGVCTRLAHLIPILILAIVVVIGAGPRRVGPPESDRVMTNILFALDLSGSMCEAFGEQRKMPDGVTIAGINTYKFSEGVYTRYHAALESMCDFASQREGDAFGLTLFGTEFLHWLPVTRDINALKTSASLLNPNSMPRWFAGTRIVNALRGCIQPMKEHPNGDRLLIVITDGESQDFINNAEITVANELRDAKITAYFISINPDVIISTLRTIASMTGGEALSCGDKQGLQRIFHHIDRMERAKVKQRHPELVDYQAPFAFGGILLVSLSLLSLLGLRFTPW